MGLRRFVRSRLPDLGQPMPRRKVTMLEAFQASAKGAAERAAAERRTLIAERERAIRRDEAMRTPGRLRRRIMAGGSDRARTEAVSPGAAKAAQGQDDLPRRQPRGPGRSCRCRVADR